MSAAENLSDTDANGVPLDGADAFMSGWQPKANPYAQMTPAYLDWIAQWHTANALAFRAHVESKTYDAIPSRTAYGIICSEYQRATKLFRLSPGNYVQQFAAAVLNRIAERAAQDIEIVQKARELGPGNNPAKAARLQSNPTGAQPK